MNTQLLINKIEQDLSQLERLRFHKRDSGYDHIFELGFELNDSAGVKNTLYILSIDALTKRLDLDLIPQTNFKNPNGYKKCYDSFESSLEYYLQGFALYNGLMFRTPKCLKKKF